MAGSRRVLVNLVSCCCLLKRSMREYTPQANAIVLSHCLSYLRSSLPARLEEKIRTVDTILRRAYGCRTVFFLTPAGTLYLTSAWGALPWRVTSILGQRLLALCFVPQLAPLPPDGNVSTVDPELTSLGSLECTPSSNLCG